MELNINKYLIYNLLIFNALSMIAETPDFSLGTKQRDVSALAVHFWKASMAKAETSTSILPQTKVWGFGNYS